jgi:SAM-dependent methyltransferase
VEVQVKSLVKRILGVHAMLVPFKTLELRRVLRELNHGDSVIDIGAGDGTQAAEIKKKTQKDVFCIDSIYGTPAEDRTSYPGRKFDVATMICVLEHVVDSRLVLMNVAESLVPGGRIVLTTDCLYGVPDELRKKHRNEHCVNKYYTEDSLREELEGCGFVNVNVEQMFNSWFAQWLFERGIKNGFKVPMIIYFPLLFILRAVPGSGHGMFLFASARRCK